MGDVKKPFQAADDKAKADRKKREQARKAAEAEADRRVLEAVRRQQADLRAACMARHPEWFSKAA